MPIVIHLVMHPVIHLVIVTRADKMYDNMTMCVECLALRAPSHVSFQRARVAAAALYASPMRAPLLQMPSQIGPYTRRVVAPGLYILHTCMLHILYLLIRTCILTIRARLARRC